MYLRSKLIESKDTLIKVIPNYNPKNESDLLFIIDSELPKPEFLLYIRVFEGLGLTYNIWNSSIFNGISIDKEKKMKHLNSWVGKYFGKCIIFPFNDPSKLNDFDPIDIINHFKESKESGLILVGDIRKNDVIQYILQETEEIEANIQANHLVTNPKKEDMNYKANQFFIDIEKKEPSQFFKLSSVKYDLKRLSTFNYSYGNVIFYKFPISKIDRLIFNPLNDNYQIIDPYKTNIFPTNSKLFSLLFTVLKGIGIIQKILLLDERGKSFQEGWRFRTKDGTEFTLVKLLNLLIYEELYNELFYPDLELSRLQLIYEKIRDDCEPFSYKVIVFSIWNILYRLESNFYWKGYFTDKLKKFDLLKKNIEILFFYGEMKRNVKDVYKIKEEAEKEVNSFNIQNEFCSNLFEN